jgi:hypothetical protein
MVRSTFVLDDRDRSAVAAFYDADGRPAIHYRFTATGAASLYSTAADLARFVQAQAVGSCGPQRWRRCVARMRQGWGWTFGDSAPCYTPATMREISSLGTTDTTSRRSIRRHA